jgi:hypothetical protein
MRRLFRADHRTPLAVAGILAFPTFFACLLLSSLAIEKPDVAEWLHEGKLQRTYHPPSSATEAKIWLVAAVPPLLLLLLGLVATWLPRGTYVVAVGGLVLALVLPLRLNTWVTHHNARFPNGVDLLPESSNSNLAQRGEWEINAKAAIESLLHWTLGLAIAVIVIGVSVTLWRRRHGVAPPPPPPPVIAGQPTVSATSAMGVGPESPREPA